jgi:hypothetical protein
MLDSTGADELKLGFWNIEDRFPASCCEWVASGCSLAPLEKEAPRGDESESKDSGGNEGATTFSDGGLGWEECCP